MSTESFTFTLREALSSADMELVCQVRVAAYGRKYPEYRESMAVPDAVDRTPQTTVFLCEDKFSGAVIGTMRVQSTTDGGELEIEKYITVPAALLQHGRAEISRLATVPGCDPLVRLALWKAGYLHCLANNIRWLVLGVRKPGLLRAYEEMGAQDVTEAASLPHGGNLLYRILGLDVLAAEDSWQRRNHPLLKFMVHTTHPDLTVPSMYLHRGRSVSENVGLHVL